MFLKKLIVKGFKSFAEHTEFEFEPGMTAVVGPNGCGKSNIVDAFKWILGEQSAKGLRGSEMKDVIFSGTETRKSLGFAEASLVFDNSHRFLDVDFAEVSVARRLFRSGESEYLINGRPCRLKDIRTLFMGTGVGRTSYSILEQGKMDILFQASPYDRRIVFEEAAGISRFRARRDEAMRQLERVEQNLERLGDIIAELEKQIHALRIQAGRARKYRDYTERLRTLRVRLAAEDYRRRVAEGAECSLSRFASELGIRRAEVHLHRIGERRALSEESRSRLRDRLSGLLRDLAGARSRRESLEERIAEARRAAEGLAQDLEARERERGAIEDGIRNIDEDLLRLEREGKDLDREIDSLGAAIEGERAELARREAALAELGERLGRERDELGGVLYERSQEEGRVAQARSQGSILGVRSGQLEHRRAGLDSELEESGREEETLRRTREQALEDAGRLREDIERKEGERSLRLEELGGLDLELGEKDTRLRAARSRYEALRELQENLEGVPRRVREVLRDRRTVPALSSVRGILADLLKVEGRHARAIEAALGGWIEAVVTEDSAGARAVIGYAPEVPGPISVISMSGVVVGRARALPADGRFIGRASELVGIDPDCQDLFRALLGNVLIAEGEDEARALMDGNGTDGGFRIATLDGRVYEPWGGVTVAGSAAGLLSRRSEMEDLSAAIASLEEEVSHLADARSGLLHSMELEAREIDRLRREETARSLQARSAEAVIGEVLKRTERLRQEMRLVASELAEVRGELEAVARIEREAGERIGALEGARRELEERIAGTEAEVARLDGESRSLGARLGDLRVERAQVCEKREGLRDAHRRMEERRRDDTARLEANRIECVAVRRRMEDAREGAERLLAELESAGGEIERLQGLTAEAEREQASLEEEIAALTREADEIRRSLEVHQEEREAARLKEQEAQLRGLAICERIQEEYGIDLARILEGGPAAAEGDAPGIDWESPFDRGAAEEEIGELEEKIRRHGNVNLEAVDELRAVEERYSFQTVERDDLVRSRRQLMGIIADLNRKSRDLFRSTFDEVQEHFGRIFRKVFGGGRAELVLEENRDILEAGIDIIARPPGKRLSSISLLSGGEKTLTSIALLFAIYQARPSPFCVLDEVDAPLDESNVRRFIVLLKEFLSRSQFVVITHNKLTMSEADTIYGVTMEEEGISRKVAVRFENLADEAALARLSMPQADNDNNDDDNGGNGGEAPGRWGAGVQDRDAQPAGSIVE